MDTKTYNIDIKKEDAELSIKIMVAAPKMLLALCGIRKNILMVLNNHSNGEHLTNEELLTFLGSLAEIAEKNINIATK